MDVHHISRLFFQETRRWPSTNLCSTGVESCEANAIQLKERCIFGSINGWFLSHGNIYEYKNGFYCQLGDYKHHLLPISGNLKLWNLNPSMVNSCYADHFGQNICCMRLASPGVSSPPHGVAWSARYPYFLYRRGSPGGLWAVQQLFFSFFSWPQGQHLVPKLTN